MVNTAGMSIFTFNYNRQKALEPPNSVHCMDSADPRTLFYEMTNTYLIHFYNAQSHILCSLFSIPLARNMRTCLIRLWFALAKTNSVKKHGDDLEKMKTNEPGRWLGCGQRLNILVSICFWYGQFLSRPFFQTPASLLQENIQTQNNNAKFMRMILY